MKTDVSYKDALFLLWHNLWWWGFPPIFCTIFICFFHFSCCSHYNMIPALPPPSLSHDHGSFRQKKQKLALYLPKLISFLGICEAETLPHPPVSSLTIIKVPLSKALSPPLLCICSVVNRQDFGCSRRTPR